MSISKVVSKLSLIVRKQKYRVLSVLSHASEQYKFHLLASSLLREARARGQSVCTSLYLKLPILELGGEEIRVNTWCRANAKSFC